MNYHKEAIVLKIYLICSVRKATKEQKQFAEGYVSQLESEGHEVHFPPRDTDQTDDGCGLAICESHQQALIEADEVHFL